MSGCTLSRRVARLEAAREPKSEGLHVLFGNSIDDTEEQQRELIRSGKARESDLFVHMRTFYEPPPETRRP